MKDSLLRKHQERVQRLKEECEACGRELKRYKDENYDLAMRLARQSEEKGTALMRNRDLQLEVRRRPSGPQGGPGWPRAVGTARCAPRPREGAARLTRRPADRPAQAQPDEGGGRLQGGAQAHAEAAARHGAAAQPGAAVGAAAGEGPAAGPRAGAGGLHPGSGRRGGRRGGLGAGLSQPGPALPASPCAPRRKGSWTRAAPTSRCWRRTGGRLCGTTRSRPTPSSPCAKTCARGRPCAPGYAAGPGARGRGQARKGAARLSSTSLPRPCWRRGARTAHPLLACSMPPPPDGQARPLVREPGAGGGRRRRGQLPSPVSRSAWRRRRCSSYSAWRCGRTPRCTRTASRPSCSRWRRSPSSGTR